jgi:hypothetical protein
LLKPSAQRQAKHCASWQKFHNLNKGKENQNQIIDREVEIKNWSHPADAVKITEGKGNQEHTIQLYTDGSKSAHGVGSGVADFAGNELAAQLKFKMDKKCSNNQAGQIVVVKALEAIEIFDITENGTRTVAIFTDSRITIDSLNNITNYNFLIEEIRKKVFILETDN